MSFSAIDLSAIPAPDVTEDLSYEAVLADMLERLIILDDTFTALLESDPAHKVLEVCAYREFMLRQRVNDAARAVMLPHATGGDLDNLAALVNVARLVIDPGDADAIPPVDPTYESDTNLRARAQLAWEGLSAAGPSGAYYSHALSADGRVADVAVTSPDAGQVLITVLSTDNDGVADAELLGIVAAALDDEDVRPLTDAVTVQAGTKTDYTITAELTIYDGPDTETVRAASEASVTAFAAAQEKLGEPVTIDGLHKALRVDGVKKVTLSVPAADIEPAATEFAHCTAIAVTIAGAA